MSDEIRQPPSRFIDILKYVGPGLILTATIVGSGEVIVTPKLGAEVGFTLLWFIILGCLVKVFVQVELGRFAVARGMTTLEAMNMMPGPKIGRASWLLWIWAVMYVAILFQIAGIGGAIATIFGEFEFKWSEAPGVNNGIWAFLIMGSLSGLLLLGRYRYLERFSIVMVAFFTVCTMIAVGAMQSTDYAITGADLASGFTFELPGYTTAFAAFGIIGVGATELIYYPYWCIEKGYAKFAGRADGSPEWQSRVRGWMRVMQVDAWISLVVYTLATIAFFVLGAAVLNRQGRDVEDANMIVTLSNMYTESFGPWAHTLFMVGAFFALFSTVFGGTAANARLFADAAGIFGAVRIDSPEKREKWIRIGVVVLPAISLVFWLAVGKPVSLVIIGAVAQGLMLPFLALAALYFRYKHTDPAIRPGGAWTAFLWISCLSMMAAGAYTVVDKLTVPAKVDLLALVKVDRDAVEGKWSLYGEDLETPKVQFGRLQIPYAPPEEYDLRAEVVRVEGNNSLVIGLRAGGKTVAVMLDSHPGPTSGIDQVDEAPFYDNPTSRKAKLFENGTAAKVRCSVRKDRLRVSVDGRWILDWRGDPSKLKLYPMWKVKEGRALFVGSWESVYRISSLELAPVSRPGELLIPTD